nr:hypothetical protein [Paenibacillus zanthoxyli]
MAAEALQVAAKAMGHNIKVETQRLRWRRERDYRVGSPGSGRNHYCRRYQGGQEPFCRKGDHRSSGQGSHQRS